MNTSIISDIVSILNTPSSKSKKRAELRENRSKRRGENRQLINCVIEMLSSHTLPLQINERIDRYTLNDISERNYDKLKFILEKSKCTFFNALCSEILWMHYHDIRLAEKSINSYAIELNVSDLEEIRYTELTLSICRIYSKCKIQSFDFESFFKKSIKYIQSSYETDNFCKAFILRGLLTCDENVEEIENEYQNIIAYYEEMNNLNKANAYLEDLEKIYKNTKEIKKLKKLRIHLAQNYEKLAENYDWSNPSDAHRIIHLIHNAMNIWERINDNQTKSERKRLAQRIEPVKKLSLKSLQTIKGSPVDITEEIELIKNSINNSTFELVIYSLAEFSSLKAEKELKKSMGNHIFSNLFATRILDNDGRIKCIIPATHNGTTNDTPLLEHQACQEYSLISEAFIKNYILLAKEKFDFTEENLEFLVNDNAFIKPERKKAFLKGLTAGFNLDLVTALHLLMPQVEHSIRCLAQDCGAVVYKTNADGIEECSSLSSILNMPEVVECLDETFLFNLRLFYVSDYGYGMRNAISHSLYSDNELQSAQGLAVWWFTFRICCMFSNELRKRIIEQQQNKKQ